MPRDSLAGMLSEQLLEQYVTNAAGHRPKMTCLQHRLLVPWQLDICRRSRGLACNDIHSATSAWLCCVTPWQEDIADSSVDVVGSRPCSGVHQWTLVCCRVHVVACEEPIACLKNKFACAVADAAHHPAALLPVKSSLHMALYAVPASLACVGVATCCPSSTSEATSIASSIDTHPLQDDFDEEQCPEGFTLQGAVPEATQAAAEDPSKPGPSAGELL